MFQSEDNILHIVQGDDVRIALTIMQPNGQPYITQEEDKIVFTLKKDISSDDPHNIDNEAIIDSGILLSYTTGGTNTDTVAICLHREDTIKVKPGYYYYDVKLYICQNPTEQVVANRTYLRQTVIPISTAVVINTVRKNISSDI